MVFGIVRFFAAVKGFGFIQPENGEKDVFVDIGAVQNAGMDAQSEGQHVSFEVVTERGKPAASSLKAAFAEEKAQCIWKNPAQRRVFSARRMFMVHLSPMWITSRCRRGRTRRKMR